MHALLAGTLCIDVRNKWFNKDISTDVMKLRGGITTYIKYVHTNKDFNERGTALLDNNPCYFHDPVKVAVML